MNVFKYEFIQNRKGLAGWTIGLTATACLILVFLPSFVEETDAFVSFLEGMGDLFLDATGLDIDLFFSATGFYSYLFMYIVLIGSIQALALGLNMLSKEVRMKTADFLLTKPQSRTKIYIGKVLAALAVLGLTQLIYYIVTYAVILFVAEGKVAHGVFWMMNLTLTFVQCIFFALGVFCSQIIRKIKSVVPAATGIALVFFMIGMVTGVTGNEIMRYAAPMKYFDMNYIMVHSSYEMEYILLSITVTIVFMAAGYILYTKKDVPSV